MRFTAVRYIDDDHRAGAPCDDLSEGRLRHLMAAGYVVDTEPEGSSWPEGLAPQAAAGLEAAGVDPEDVASMTDDELDDVDGVGPASARILREALGGPPEATEEPEESTEDVGDEEE